MSQPLVRLLVLGLVVRLMAVLFIEVHDQSDVSPYESAGNVYLKYTDIDYEVLNDAAALAHAGRSPYERSTYRYTPLFSWIMILNMVSGYKWLGKLLFITADVVCAFLLHQIASKLDKHEPCNVNQSSKYSTVISVMWLFNPFVIAISARGNTEGLVACLVAATLYYLLNEKQSIAGLMLALAVHFKIYPVIFSFSILKFLFNEPGKLIRLLITGAICSIALLTLMFHLYRWEFLENAYLYHLSRKDHRHNFSLQNVAIYTTFDNNSGVLASTSILPQILLMVFISGIYSNNFRQLLFAWFLLTYTFVTFNKVITSQYFVWFLSLSPFLFDTIKIKPRKVIVLTFLWIIAQMFWLNGAYGLEMNGKSNFFIIWLASLLFFSVNIAVILNLIKSFHQI